MVLLCRFQQCPAPFTMFLVKGSSETGLFRHLSNRFSLSVFAKNHKLSRSYYFLKCSKLELHVKNAVKISQKRFFFWDNSIWIGCVKFSLLRTEYLSSVVNVLTANPKMLHITKRDFFQLNFLCSSY